MAIKEPNPTCVDFNVLLVNIKCPTPTTNPPSIPYK
jgi:hypothetical protein